MAYHSSLDPSDISGVISPFITVAHLSLLSSFTWLSKATSSAFCLQICSVQPKDCSESFCLLILGKFTKSHALLQKTHIQVFHP